MAQHVAGPGRGFEAAPGDAAHQVQAEAAQAGPHQGVHFDQFCVWAETIPKNTALKKWEPTERVYLHFLMPGNRDAISFLREINSFFSILGNIFWLICNCIYSAQFIIHFKLHFQDFFYKKITKLLVQI
jgi:hypothetical protein